MATAKRRLDDELVEQGLFDSRDEAMRSVLAGMVSSRGERLTKPGQLVVQGIPLHVKGSAKTSSSRGFGKYVGRGGLKLEGALADFSIDVSGMSCLDVGCSTGGFTDCLLKHGASHVCAVDVGYGQFDWSLRGDSRISLHERTNICSVDTADLGGPFDLAVADVSFTAVSNISESVAGMLSSGGLFCTLVKPQFEARRSEVGTGGIVTDPLVHERVLCEVARDLAARGFAIVDCTVSPITGAKGNIEYFILAATGTSSNNCAFSDSRFADVVDRAWKKPSPTSKEES